MSTARSSASTASRSDRSTVDRRAADLGGDGLRRLGVPVDHEDVGAGRGQPHGAGAPDARRPAGDQRASSEQRSAIRHVARLDGRRDPAHSGRTHMAAHRVWRRVTRRARVGARVRPVRAPRQQACPTARRGRPSVGLVARADDAVVLLRLVVGGERGVVPGGAIAALLPGAAGADVAVGGVGGVLVAGRVRARSWGLLVGRWIRKPCPSVGAGETTAAASTSSGRRPPGW